LKLLSRPLSQVSTYKLPLIYHLSFIISHVYLSYMIFHVLSVKAPLTGKYANSVCVCVCVCVYTYVWRGTLISVTCDMSRRDAALENSAQCPSRRSVCTCYLSYFNLSYILSHILSLICSLSCIISHSLSLNAFLAGQYVYVMCVCVCGVARSYV